ncbi:MAG: cell wall-binding repeat-containing protein [Coriobacteriia bacterium]
MRAVMEYSSRRAAPLRLITQAVLAAVLITTLSLVAPVGAVATAGASTWIVDTYARSEADIRAAWNGLKPTYAGTPYVSVPSIVYPYTPGGTVAAFRQDGVNMLNFGRYLAGLPADVTLLDSRNLDGQYGAVLLAKQYSHTPVQPADMSDDFYQRGYASTSSSNIGWGYTDLESFQIGCLDDSDAGNLPMVGHRRWLLNPEMLYTGMGFAGAAYPQTMTTYAFDSSRPTDQIDYAFIAWPSAGLFPVERAPRALPWSISLNPARYDWDLTGHTIALRRLSDGKTWNFDASDTNTAGEYFNANFGGYGSARNAFIFRPAAADLVTSYSAGEQFDVTLSGGIYAEGTRTPVTVKYRTSFCALSGAETVFAAPTTVFDKPATSVFGASRIETAIEASKLGFPEGSGCVVIATALSFPDALGGAGLAGSLDAPILLTYPTTLPGSVIAEIARLEATHVIVLGGEGAVSDDVFDALEALPDVTAERIWGATRYATAEAIAGRTIIEMGSAWDGTAFVATGESFPDALGASPIAAAKGWPIYLLPPDTATHSQLVATMQDNGVTSALVLGGTGVVPATFETMLNTALTEARVERLAGEDRYTTALDIAKYGVTVAGLSWDKLAIATGADFPDALAGGPLQGASDSVMLLAHPNGLNAEVCDELTTCATTIAEVRFLGGIGAIPQTVRDAVGLAIQ